MSTAESPAADADAGAEVPEAAPRSAIGEGELCMVTSFEESELGMVALCHRRGETRAAGGASKPWVVERVPSTDHDPHDVLLVGRIACRARTRGPVIVANDSGTLDGFELDTSGCDSGSFWLAVRGAGTASAHELVTEHEARGAARTRRLLAREGIPVPSPFDEYGAPDEASVARFAIHPRWQVVRATWRGTEETDVRDESWLTVLRHRDVVHTLPGFRARSTLEIDDRTFVVLSERGASLSHALTHVLELRGSALVPRLVICERTPAGFTADGCGTQSE